MNKASEREFYKDDINLSMAFYVREFLYMSVGGISSFWLLSESLS
jgi:hypothetical protein